MISVTWTDFKLYLEFERSIKITSSHKSCFLKLSSYFSRLPFTRENMRRYMAYLSRTEKLTNGTINKYLTIAKHIDNYLGLKCLTDFKKLNVDENKEKFILTDNQMRSIADCYIGARRCERSLNRRMRAAISTLRFTAMRPDELVNLKHENDCGTHFELAHTKTHTNRKVPIPSPLRAQIDALPHFSHGYIFGGPHGQMKAATLNHEIQLRCAKLNIKQRVTAYTFRYSTITWTFLNGGENALPRLSKIFGHSLNTSFKYYQNYNIKMLSDILEQSHPGLRKTGDIDTLKRILLEIVKGLVDASRFDVYLEIMPKSKAGRQLYIS